MLVDVLRVAIDTEPTIAHLEGAASYLEALARDIRAIGRSR
jgi:hypothetical protein